MRKRRKSSRAFNNFFYNERGEEIGYIAAETILDFIMKDISPFIYNKAIQEAQKLVMDRMQSLDDDLYAMKKPIWEPESAFQLSLTLQPSIDDAEAKIRWLCSIPFYDNIKCKDRVPAKEHSASTIGLDGVSL